MRGPALEEALGREGLTFGHLPQSWEFATLGGYAATRSAGQHSTGVGRFDELVAGVTLATPSGVLELGHPPATRGRPRPARSRARLRGHARRHHRAHLRVRPKPSAPRTRADVPVVGGRPRGPAAAGPARTAGRYRPALQRRPNRADLLMASGDRARALRGPRAVAATARWSRCWCAAGKDLSVFVRARSSLLLSLLRDGGGDSAGLLGGASRGSSDWFAAPGLRDELLDAGLLVKMVETVAVTGRCCASCNGTPSAWALWLWSPACIFRLWLLIMSDVSVR